MIIVRAPLRITLGGGGTDVPSYYRQNGGRCIAAAIDKYVYITVHETFVDELIIKYSDMEVVTELDQIRHPIIREVACMEGIQPRRLELSSMADIPAGTGLGSSSSFTVALIKAIRLYQHHNDWLPTRGLAERACAVEINKLHEPIGKQDQYIAAFGGIRSFTFTRTDEVMIEPVFMSTNTRSNLEDNLLLFFTGYTRNTATVLNGQLNDTEANLRQVHAVADATEQALVHGDLDQFGELLDEQWRLKRSRLSTSSNEDIDHWYALGKKAGATGGKLVGAGGGGFLLFYTEHSRALRKAMTEAGRTEVRFKFDNDGARAILQ